MKKGVADVSAVCTMNNQRPNPPRKKIKPTDLILFAVAIFLLFMTPWGNTNSYHRLMLFLYFLCVLLRFSNIRKQKMREFEHKRKMEERAAMQQATEALPAKPLPQKLCLRSLVKTLLRKFRQNPKMNKILDM